MCEQDKVRTTDKGAVIEHVCTLPPPLDGVEVVVLEIVHGTETRYRLRTPAGNEGRISEATTRHMQQQKLHADSGIYNIRNGWIAIVTEEEDGSLAVDIGFAGVRGRYFVEAPASKWYIAVLSDNVAFSYGTSDDNTGKIDEDGELYKRVEKLTHEDIFMLYAKQHDVEYQQVLRWSGE